MAILADEDKLYTYEELSFSAQQVAYSKWYQGQCQDDDWYDSVFEDVKRTAEILGITIDKIYFSGFSSQGDGACFEGSYEYKPGWKNAFLHEYGKDNATVKEPLRIGQSLQELQARYFYRLSANCKHRGHYHHSGCTSFNVYRDGEWADAGIEDELVPILRDYMDYIYKQLNNEYDYLTSEKRFIEQCDEDSILFNEDGEAQED
jgi:hypothetical protein